jgi:thiol-disulfide isomerase/thioredoxin
MTPFEKNANRAPAPSPESQAPADAAVASNAPRENRPAMEAKPEPTPAASDTVNTENQAAASEPPRRRPTWGEVEKNRLPQLAIANPGARSASSGVNAGSRLFSRPRQSSPAQGSSLRFQAACQYDSKNGRLIDFMLADLRGQPFLLSQTDADMVLLDFWGTWCGPCLDTIPHLIDLQSRYGSRLKVIGIAYEDGTVAERAAAVTETAKKLGINYTLLLGGADGRPCPLQAALYVQAYPTMVLLDRNGKILWRVSGSDASTLSRLDRAVAARAGQTATVRR